HHDLRINKNIITVTFKLEEGMHEFFSLDFVKREEPVRESSGGDLNAYLADQYFKTIRFWQWWISQCSYRGSYFNQVTRSALTLKLLTFSPTGAIIAAPTTSLPEKIGGTFNWDYRYTWLRDASFTVYSFLGLGYIKEAERFM